MLITLWSTTNIKSLFPLKEKAVHQSYVIYEGECSCKSNYIGEIKRNSEVRWKEHQRSCWKTRTRKALNRKRFS